MYRNDKYEGSIPPHRIKQLNRVHEINRNKYGVHSLHKILKGTTLRNFQTCAIAHAYLSNRSICALEMGLGKTLCALGFIVTHKEMGTGNKFLYITKPGGLMYQTLSQIELFTDFKALPIFGDRVKQDRIFQNYDVRKADGLVVSYTALGLTSHFSKRFIRLREGYDTIVYDESLQLANHNTGIHQTMKYMLPSFDNKMFLTGTPIINKMSQLTNQLNLLDEKLGLNPRNLEGEYGIYHNNELKGFHSLDILFNKLSNHIFSESRDSLGINNTYDYRLHRVTPNTEQMLHLTPSNWKEVLKAPYKIKGMKTKLEETSAFKKLIDLILEDKDGKMVIFIWHIDVKYILKEYLNKMYPDLFVEVIDGRTSEQEKFNIQTQFNNLSNGIILTNLEEGLNLKAGRMIFFEYPMNFPQAMYRVVRNVDEQEVLYDLIVYKGTPEVKELKNRLTLKEGIQNAFLKRGYDIIKRMREQLVLLENYDVMYGEEENE